MEFTKEALELLQTTAQKAAEAKLIDLPLAGRSAAVELKMIGLPPTNRAHRVRTLADLARYTIAAAQDHDHKVTSQANYPGGPPVLYHNEAVCVLVLDDADRRDFVRFELNLSEEWQVLTKLRNETPLLSQREVIQLLRLVFNASPALIAAFRRFELKARTGGASEINRGRESLGQSVEQEIVNATDIPDVITLTVPIYRNLDEDRRYDVACAVELDVVNARAQIVPEPGRLDEVMHLHQADIGERLRAAFAEEESSDLVAVYYGTP